MLNEKRSASQILFSLLPEQTVDLSGRVWKVAEWRDPVQLNVDDSTVRRRLLAALDPWRQANRDANASRELREHHPVEVVSLNRQRGVRVEPWPQVFVCQNCRRIGNQSRTTCRCGAIRWRQLHFVGYHSCGSLFQPWIPRCPEHDDVAMNAPGTAQAKDLRFNCPACHRELLRGLGAGRPCPSCHQPATSYTVHRAASVYTSHSITMVNPPRPEYLRTLTAAGGAARCLDWVIDGMPGDGPDVARASRETLIEGLIAQGMAKAVAEAAADTAVASGHTFSSSVVDDDLTESVREGAQSQALDLALAVHAGRRQAHQLPYEPVGAELQQLYAHRYPPALRRAGLAGADLVDRFPVLRGVFGYSRAGGTAGDSRIVMFRGRSGALRVYADSIETEALLLRLDPLRVAAWLRSRGHQISVPDNPRAARLAIMRATSLPNRGDQIDQETAGSALLTLLHSYTHRLIRQVAVLAGIDREALAEYLLPTHLSTLIYAGSRGDFILGGLQALFERDLDMLLDSHVDNDHRCPLDPACSRGTGACLACLHLGEPSCTYYNRFLDRRTLFGSTGYLAVHGND